MDFLGQIVESTRASVDSSMRARPLADLKRMVRDTEPARDFRGAVARKPSDPLKLIAEVKKASPSKGLLRQSFDPVAIAAVYQEAGAAAVSVLTENRFFLGRPEYIGMVRKGISLPILRKDFLLTEYQVYESRALQADAVLLIVSLLDDHQIKGFSDIASELGMSCLAEVHSDSELDRGLALGLDCIGINNRDLKTFETDLKVALRLVEKVPADRTTVAESGISTREDIEKLAAAGIHAVLIGEAFMLSPDIKTRIRELFGNDDAH